MFCGNSVIIGMIILLVVGYLVVYGSSSTTIREGMYGPTGHPTYKPLGGGHCISWTNVTLLLASRQ